jgi:ATP-dependent Lon protease
MRIVEAGDKQMQVTVEADSLEQFLGVPKFRYGEREENAQVGVATGLAWTQMGGELLLVETVLMPGKGKLAITGKLGDVMQESAKAAISYLRSRSDVFGLKRDFHQEVDIHVHVPEGATPKDGPSAGITLATAVASALLNIPVRNDLAMTGEITLRGRVLPIGGLREKLLAAHRGQIKTVLIPRDNEKDLRDVPQEIKDDLTILPVEHMDEVLEHALACENADAIFCGRGDAVEPIANLLLKEQRLEERPH